MKLDIKSEGLMGSAFKCASPLPAAKEDSLVYRGIEFAFHQAVGAGANLSDEANVLICCSL